MHDHKKGAVLRTDKLSHSIDKATRPIDIGIDEKNRQAVVDLLQPALANLNILYNKTRNFHWNITGPRFHTLHLFLEEQYKELAEAADEVAERIRQLGGFAIGTLKEYLAKGELTEEPGVRPPADGMIATLVADHETIIKGLREDIDKCDDDYEDTGTADFLTRIDGTTRKDGLDAAFPSGRSHRAQRRLTAVGQTSVCLLSRSAVGMSLSA